MEVFKLNEMETFQCDKNIESRQDKNSLSGPHEAVNDKKHLNEKLFRNIRNAQLFYRDLCRTFRYGQISLTP